MTQAELPHSKEHVESTKNRAVFFLLYHNDQVLLERRINPGERYDARIIVPGGNVKTDIRETFDNALIREMDEERGVFPTKWFLLDSYDYTGPSGKHFLSCAYLVVQYKGTAANKESDKAEDVWISVDLAETLVTYVNDKYILMLAREKLLKEGL